MAKERVDVLAYKQGLFDTREQAKRGVMAGLVVAVINGERFDKPGEKIDEATELKLKGEKLKYVSRGGLKLEKALNQFGLSVEGKIAIDIGASTGGFTDVMLQNGASQVFSVDVGTNQLAWKLRNDPRVVSMEQFNFRYAEPDDFEATPSFASIDVSFISLDLILPALHRILAENGQVVALVKPQFEAGREQIGKNGIIKDPKIHLAVLEKVVAFAKKKRKQSQRQSSWRLLWSWHTRNLNMKSKNIRLEKIRRFIRDHEVGTQEEIVEHLKEEGISATQATVSRDIKELGIVKRPLKDMTYVYELPRKHHQGIGMIESNILSHRRMGEYVNFTMVPGTAPLVKRRLREIYKEHIFSIVADDDTILLIAYSAPEAENILKSIFGW